MPKDWTHCHNSVVASKKIIMRHYAHCQLYSKHVPDLVKWYPVYKRTKLWRKKCRLSSSDAEWEHENDAIGTEVTGPIASCEVDKRS
jgi:hypothetical protein